MKQLYFFVAITALASFRASIEAQQPELTNDGLLSYQDELWNYKGGSSTEIWP